MFAKIQKIISEELDVELEQVTKDADILADLGADSLDVVELIMALEEAFDISVDDAQAQKMKTVGDIVAYIEKMRQ